ncbi:MFS general substrate transporter [Lichtheimia hyalospora FSU 10163]|nr:MFS general substrate transporter [Lichtheimia hyalospora FSU 10163]
MDDNVYPISGSTECKAQRVDDAPVLEEKEKRYLMFKLDRRIVPFLALLYLCSFLDRVNIGNAKIAGIVDDLGMSESMFNWALSIFFIGYVIFEVPANLFLKLIGPRYWISLIMLVWGVIMAAMSACKDGPSLLAARFFLGIAESGLFPGIAFYLSVWYPRRNQSVRISMVWASSTIAGASAFGGLLAYGIMYMDGLQGLHGWQWIFIIEALPTLCLAIVTLIYLPDYPETSTFLSATEKEAIVYMIDHDSPAKEKHFSWRQVAMALMDWKTYAVGSIQLFTAVCMYSFSLFLPSIIVGMGYNNIHAQLMSAPPYAVACTLTMICAYTSDKYVERGYHCAGCCLIGMVGYVMLSTLQNHDNAILYGASIIAASGVFPVLSLTAAWNSNNHGGRVKRAVAIAVVSGMANCGGIIAGQVYRADDAPKYIRGHTICVAMMGAACVLSFLTKMALARENKKRDTMTQQEHAAACEGNELCDQVLYVNR